jgi:hypothetical protein
MAELIREHHTHIRTPEGLAYVAHTVGAQTRIGEWDAWLEFLPVSGHGPVLRTEHETHQATRDALEVWASGLEMAYFEGAFARAHVVASR